MSDATRKPLEKRQFICEVRAEDNDSGSIITGRPIVYESRTNLGDFDEIIHKGALDKTDLKDVRFLVNHDLSRIPLARSRKNNANSTMQLSVDGDGLTVRAKLDTENNAEARALYSAVQRGDISGMSFMFSIDNEEWEDLDGEHPTRHIKAIGTVVEVSAVTLPAYEATEINARANTDALENARAAALENARNAQAVDTASALELEKLKAKYLYNI